MKRILLALIVLTTISGATAIEVNGSINYGQIIKTLKTNTWGYNNHLDYTAYPTWLDNDSSGSAETLSNVTWHRAKAVESKVEIWRGDTRWSSKYAGLNQGVLDNASFYKVTTPYNNTNNISSVTGWNMYYTDVNYELRIQHVDFEDSDGAYYVNNITSPYSIDSPGSKALIMQVGSDIYTTGPGFGKATLWQTIPSEANNGSKFDLLVTTTESSGYTAILGTDATCINNHTTDIGNGWYRKTLGNCTKTAGTSINVSVIVPGFFSIHHIVYIGGVRTVYSSNQETMIGWRTDTLNNFANINSDRDMLEWAYNETNNGRPTTIALTGFHMPAQIGNRTTDCASDSRGCSYSDEKSFTDMIKSYLSYITRNGQYCSIIDHFGVWNEPDLTEYWLDDVPTGNTTRWTEYNNMYRVAWNAAKNSTCGSNLKVGGPDLASIITSDGNNFVQSFLGNFSSNMIDVLSWHRYPSATISDPASSAVSLEGTINITKNLLHNYSVNTSNVCVMIAELNENNQNIVQNYSKEAYSSYNSMMAEVATENLCLYLTFYQWADDSPWGTSTAEGNSTGIRRIALQEPLNGGEQLYSLYNATRGFYNNVSGGSIIYNSTDNQTSIRIVASEKNLTKRFGIVNSNNETANIIMNIGNITANNMIADNGTIYNLTGTTTRTATIYGIPAYETTWYTINTTTLTLSNGTCYSTNYVNYCLNTDVYLYNNVTINNDTIQFDEYTFNITTTTGYVNVTINVFDIYGNNNMTMKSLTASNVVTAKISTPTNNYINVYSGTEYDYGSSFIASTTPTNYYYTTGTEPINEWFVNASINGTNEIINNWQMLDGLNDGSGTIYATNNGSILFNGLHDNSGNGKTITRAEECTIGRIESTDVITRSGYISCNDPNNLPILGKTNELFPDNNTWGITTFIRPYTISPNGTPDTIFFFSRDDGSTGNNSAITIRTKNNSTLEMSFRNGSNTTETFTIGSISTGQWTFLAITYDGTTLKAYMNNILVLTRTRTFHGFGTANATIYGIGSGEKYSGDIGVTRIYNELNYDTTYIYNEYYRNSSISNYQTAFYNFKTYNATETVTGTASANSYYDIEFSSINTGTPYNFLFGQSYSQINLTVKEGITNNIVSNYTIGFEGASTASYTVNTTNAFINLSWGEYNYTINKTGYFSKKGALTSEGYSQNTTIYNLTSHYLAVRFSNSILGINETNFTVSAYSSNYNITITANTTNGTVIIPWFSDNNFNITAYNGQNTSNTVLTTRTNNVTGPAIVNYTLTGVISNSVYFSFFDEQTQQLLNGTNVTVYITSSTYTYNFTESSGNRTIDNIQAGNYVVTATAPGYVTRTYNFVLENGGSAQQVIYLLNNNTGTYIRFTVLDQSYNVLQEATINAVRKNISGTNYYEVGDCTTDNNGECIINLETLTATYRFVACYQTTCYTTPDTTLSRDTYPIVINLGSNGLEQVFEDSNIQTGITYNNGTFTYTVIDTNNNVRNSYVTISRINGGREIPLETITGTGTTIVLTSSYANVSIGDGIVARGYTVMQGNPVLTSILTAVPNNLGTGRNASLILLFLGLTITVVFIFSWNPIAPPIIFGVMLMIFQRIGLVTIGVETLAAVFVIIGIAIFRMRNV